MDIGKLSHCSLLLLTLCLAGDAAVRKINSSFNTSTIQSSQKQIQPLQYRIVTGEKYVYVERPTIEEIIERGFILKVQLLLQLMTQELFSLETYIKE